MDKYNVIIINKHSYLINNNASPKMKLIQLKLENLFIGLYQNNINDDFNGKYDITIPLINLLNILNIKKNNTYFFKNNLIDLKNKYYKVNSNDKFYLYKNIEIIEGVVNVLITDEYKKYL